MFLTSFIFYFLSIFLIFAYSKGEIHLKFIFINFLFCIFIIIDFKFYKFSELILVLHSTILFLIILIATSKNIDFWFLIKTTLPKYNICNFNWQFSYKKNSYEIYIKLLLSNILFVKIMTMFLITTITLAIL